MYLVRKCTLPCHLVRTASTAKNNFYTILGVKASATQGEIKSAYYELSKVYHPDSNKGSEDSLAKFRQITDAYEVLGNVSSRRLYDRGLVVGGSSTILREDVAVDPTVEFYRRREKRQEVPIPLDRETVYDFDAWTRAHYVKAKDRRYAAKVRHDFKMDRHQGTKHRTRMDRTVLGVCMALLGFLGILEVLFGEKYDESKRTKIEKDST